MDLDEVTAALRALPGREEDRERAARNLTAWWQGAAYAPFRPQLESLVRAQRWTLLLDSFYRTIPFGTGGRRGPVGIGPNRLNQETVLTSVQGHVDYLRRRYGTAPLRVVVAYDVRVFRDLRGLYDPAVPNPLLGLSSRDLARMACAVYAANQVEVYTVPGDDDFFLSTPELSFAIRHLRAHGGLNISASHNHPDDNGAKFYMADGGQPVPPDDEDLANVVDLVEAVSPGSFDDAVRSGLIRWWDPPLHERYLEANLSRSIDPSARTASIVYTPLHGTGLHSVGDLLRRAGFTVHLVEEQAQPDGAFPTVKFRIPNPEIPESMELLTATAKRLGACAGLATDPDADRLGVVVPDRGGWRPLSGNELAVLLAVYIVERRRDLGTLPPRGFFIKTSVTTALLTRIARANGLQMEGDLLVGFKYIGQVLEAIATHGRFGKLQAAPGDFLFAAEESNGVQVSAELRDKDAAGGALLLAELCAWLQQQGRSLADYIEEIHCRYGFAANSSYSLVMEGLAGAERLRTLMDRLRQAAPPALDGKQLQEMLDHWDIARFGPLRSETDRSARNFLQLQYAGELRVSVRPSGTEPKLKIYLEQLFDPQPAWSKGGFAAARRDMDTAAAGTTLVFVEHLLRLIDIELPRPALLLSPLVSLDNRIDFAQHFLPELEKHVRAAAPDASQLGAWVDQRLQQYGTDPRRLVAAGVPAYFETVTLSPAQRRVLDQVFDLQPV